MDDFYDDHILAYRTSFKHWLVNDGLQGQKTHLVKLKYCNTCMIYRPRRAVHCQNCDSCVEQFDHHCPFISTCVGRRNYTSFFFFVVMLLVDCIFLFAVTAHDLDRRLNDSLLLSVTKEKDWS